jgi:hypothetical protein
MRMPLYQMLLATAIVAMPAAAQHTTHAASANAEYVAHLTPLNAKASGHRTSAEATFKVRGDSLTIDVRARGLAPDLVHLQHFHGFTDGHQASCPTVAQDTNHDGVIDLMETAPTSGETMVPFTADPVSMEIVVSTYPKASADGTYHYQKTVSLSALDAAFGKKYNGQKLQLEHRVVFIHGVPETTKLPATVASLGDIPAQVTIPIACGEIKHAK